VVTALNGVAAALARARVQLAGDAHPLAQDGLRELEVEVERLRLDVQLATATEPEDADRLMQAIEAVLVSRLPPVPDLATRARAADPAHPVPGISWYLHFVAGPLRAGPKRFVRR
jgi:hypothetical protein